MEHTERIENERKAVNYETFLKRGFKFNKRFRKPHKSELANLIDFENGIKQKFLPNRENQLYKIKERLSKTIDLILENCNMDEIKKKDLSELYSDIAKANSSSDINRIVESGLYLTQDYK